MSALDVSTLSIEARSTGIKETADGLNKIFQEGGKAEKRVISLTASIDKLSNAFQQGAASARAYQQAIQLSNATVGASSASQSALTAAIGQLNSSITKLVAGLSTMTVTAKKSAEAVVFTTNAMNDAHAAARGLSGSLGALWVTYGNMLPLAAGLAIGASFKQIVVQGTELEHTLESIRVKGQETVESIDRIRTSALDLGKGIYGPQEVAKAFETMILAGLKADQALSGISDALNLATIGGTTIEKSAYTLVQVGTALGYTAESYSRISDVIAKTAAVSMSSVESLSEAFKAASAVGKLYGVTLEDIGTSLAALSNLGIQGTAAGTSLKNFYKELASESKKVSDTFKDLKISQASLKDSHGNFLPLAELLPKLNAGLNTMKESEQKIALNRIANERGLKTLVELLDLYRQKGEGAATAFAALQDQVKDSFAYSAIGAAQMSLTIENQFKSVRNTLQTVFAQIGKDLSPQFTLIASQLKDVFNSPEFIQGLRTIATEFANFALLVAQHIPTIVKLVETFLAFKAFMFIVEFLTSVRAAFLGLSAGAAALGLTLGPLTVALMAAGAAYLYFTSAKNDQGLSDSQRAAIQNSEDYANALDKETDRLRTQLELLKQGASARDAETQSIMSQQLQLAKLQGDKAKMEAEGRLERAGMGVTLKDIEISDSIVKRGGMATTAVKEFRAAQANLAEVNAKVDASFTRLTNSIKATTQAAKDVEEQRKKNLSDTGTGGTGVLTPKADNAGINDAYRAELNRIQGEVEAAQRLLKATLETNDELYKTGQIGRIQQVRANGEAAIAMYHKEADAYQQMIDTAAPKNKLAVQQSIGNKLVAAEENAAQAIKQIQEQEAIYYTQLQKQTTEHTIKELEARGQYVQAAELKYGDLNRVQQSQIANDITAVQKQIEDATVGQVSVSERALSKLVEKYNLLLAAQKASGAEQRAIMNEAAFKEAQNTFTTVFNSARNSIDELNEKASAEGGWIARFFSADAVETAKARTLPAIQAALAEEIAVMQKMTDEAKTDEERKAVDAYRAKYEKDYHEYLKFLNKQNETFKQAMQEIDRIGEEGFEALFSNVSGAWSSWLSKLKADFKKMLIDELYKMVAKPIILQIVANIAGITGLQGIAGAARGQFAAGNGGSSFGNSGGLFSNFGGTTANLANQASVLSGQQYGTGFMSEQSRMLAEQESGMGAATDSFAQSVGTFSNAAGAVVSYASAIKALTDGKYGQAAGTAIGQYFGGPIGAYIGSQIGSWLDKQFSGETRGGGQYAYSFNGTVNNNRRGSTASAATGSVAFLEGPSGGELASDQVKMAISDTVTTINSLLKGVGSSASLQGFQAGLETSGEGRGGVFAGGKLSTGTSFGLSGAGDNYAGTLFDKHFSNSPDAKTAVENFITDLKQTTLQALQAATDIPKSIADQLKGVDVKALTDQQASDLVNKITEEIASVSQFQSAVATLPFKNLKNLSFDAANSLIKLNGGLSSLDSKVQFFAQNFMTEAERTASMTEYVNKQMSDLGESNITTREQFKGLVQGLDLTTDAGQKLYTQLMDLAPAFAQIHQEAQVDNSLRNLEIQLNEESGDTLTALTKKRQDELAAMDASLRPMQERIYALQDAKQAFDDAMSKAGTALETLRKSVDAQKTLVQNNAQAQIDAIKKKTEADINTQKDRLKIAQDAQNAITSIFESLKGALKSTEIQSVQMDQARRQAAQATLQDALRSAQGGASLTSFNGLGGALDALNKPSEQFFSTFEDYARDQTLTKQKIEGLADLAGAEKDKQQLTIDAINATIDSIQKASDAQISAVEAARDAELARLDGIVNSAQSQLDALKGIDDSTKSVESALQSFTAAIIGAKSAQMGVAAAGGVTARISNAPANYMQWLALHPGIPQEQSSLDYYNRAINSSSLASYDVGTNYVTHDQVANIHQGERIIPAADNAELMNRLRSGSEVSSDRADLVDAINRLEQCIISGDVANVQQGKEFVKIIRKWDGEGMPTTRS